MSIESITKALKRSWGVLLITALVFFGAFSVSALAGVEAKEVITGKDGWLFYDSDRSISDYKGTDLFTDLQLVNIRSRLTQAKEYFEERGIEFVIFLPPNKEHVYSEYMPDSYGPPASYTRIDQLCDCLGDEFTIVTPLQNLLVAKMFWPQYEFYYRTDAHWNELGSYIGAQTLAGTTGKTLPAFLSLRIRPYITSGRELAQPLGLEESIWDMDYVVQGYGRYNNTYYTEESDDGNHLHYRTEGAPAENMVIFGDSFAMGMAPYLGQFYQNIYLHRFEYRKSDIEAEQPSVVVLELVERSLDYMLLFELTD